MKLLLALILIHLTTSFVIEQPLPAYNVTDSQDVVRFAAVAFCNKECVSTWTCKTGLSVPLTNSFYVEHFLTKAAGFVGYSSIRNQIILSFRGSNNVQNWIEDANFEKLPYARCLFC